MEGGEGLTLRKPPRPLRSQCLRARFTASILAKDTRIKSGAKRAGMRSTAVDSEDVESARYDPDTLELEIRFSSSPEVHVFRNIPIALYRNLMTAKSVGAYFAEHVKDHYPFTRKAK